MTTIGTVAAGQTAVLTPSRRRFVVMALLFVTVVINYLDRSNMSIAAPALAGEFHLDPVQLGLVFSAFGWTYTPFQLPGGWLVDRVHPRILYPATIMLWSLATLTLGLATGLLSLIVLRMAVGLFEVPTFLINNRIATTWFGEKERATCIAVYTAAESVGLAFMTPAAVLAEGGIRLAVGVLLHRRSGPCLGLHLLPQLSRSARDARHQRRRIDA